MTKVAPGPAIRQSVASWASGFAESDRHFVGVAARIETAQPVAIQGQLVFASERRIDDQRRSGNDPVVDVLDGIGFVSERRDEGLEVEFHPAFDLAIRLDRSDGQSGGADPRDISLPVPDERRSRLGMTL